MKPKWFRALGLLPFLGLLACGGGGSNLTTFSSLPPNTTPVASPSPNTAPIAKFSYSCTDLACSFQSNSSDSDVGGSITKSSWTLGDGSPAVTGKNIQHTYAAANTYDVTLTVTDNAGATGTVTEQVAVEAPVAGSDITSKFSLNCASSECTFTDASTTEAGGAIQSRLWEFGDGGTSTVQNPVHVYSVTKLTTFSVKLTVTSAAGFVSVSSQNVQVAPPASTLNCPGGGVCTLRLEQAATVTVTLESSECGAHNNQFLITAPVAETFLTDGCYAPVGPVSSLVLKGGQPFDAGTQIVAEVLSGVGGNWTLAFDPVLRVTGDFANGWTLEFDDGAGGPGEPDFDDLVVSVRATPL